MMDGPPSTTSSITSTSHTLTYVPNMVNLHMAEGKMTPDMLAFLHAIESNNRHTFLKPPPSIPAASLQLAKDTLDAFAPHVSDEQQQLQKEANKKRKRKADAADRLDVLKIRKLHVDGFETGQVWQQARKIISSVLDFSRNALEELEGLEEIEEESESEGVEDTPAENDIKMIKFDEEGFEVGSSDEEGEEYDEDESAQDVSDEEVEEESTYLSDGNEELRGSDIDDDDDFAGFSDAELGREGDEDADGDSEEESEPAGTYVEDPNGLNDGFFSIDEFNKQTQWFEDRDAHADPNTDAASDDEEVDWHADPFATAKSNNGNKSKRDEPSAEDENAGLSEDDQSDEEGGPTFGDMDLDVSEGASEDGDIGAEIMGGLDLTANDIYYKDFFAQPPRKTKKGQNPSRKSGPPNETASPAPGDTEEDFMRGIRATKRDLFDDLDERSMSSDAEISDSGDPRNRRSKHEKWQSKISTEISQLEAASVAKRNWAVMGEASATSRPANSLLETDLDWDFAGRRAPVATEETTADIAAIVKRRILAREFDEVLRRRPEAMDASVRRGLQDLAPVDTEKSSKSLAEIYEEEHQKKTNPDVYVSKAAEKLQREEREIEALWRDVSAKLDALSSWHYKPRPVEAALHVVADVGTVAMEDAQPTTAAGMGIGGATSMLAPQEVYKPGQQGAGENGEVVGKDGLPVARQEMSREEKRSRRRREKERGRKAGSGANGAVVNGTTSKSKAEQQKETVEQLKRGGVKVINRKGEIVDVEGKKAKAKSGAAGAEFKL